MSNATLRRYALPSVKGEGWAIIVIGSDGYFSTVSDWGNYAYLWTHPGCEFRHFLAGLDADYFWGRSRVASASSTSTRPRRTSAHASGR